MKGELVPVVLIPRFTTFAGEGVYDSAPIDVTAFDQLVVVSESGAKYGTGIATESYEESHDGIRWFPLTDTGSGTLHRFELNRRWLRVVVEIGVDTAITKWCQGNLRRRVA